MAVISIDEVSSKGSTAFSGVLVVLSAVNTFAGVGTCKKGRDDDSKVLRMHGAKK